jgi:hypothetical protein
MLVSYSRYLSCNPCSFPSVVPVPVFGTSSISHHVLGCQAEDDLVYTVFLYQYSALQAAFMQMTFWRLLKLM